MREFIQPTIGGLDPGRLLPQGAAAYRARIEDQLAGICAGFSARAPDLGTAMAEAVMAPGKRFRGTLMLLVAARTGGVTRAVTDAAVALELIHAASLIIDDLPAMDGATLRRGRPTTHVAHGESRAILAGIALVSEAFRLLAVTPGPEGEVRARTVAILAECVGPAGLCAGQDMDLHAPKTLHSVTREQDLKTGALFAAGFRIIAALQGHGAERTEALVVLSWILGRAFQSLDDLRDVAGSAELLGKDTGLDAGHGVGEGFGKGLLAVSRYDEALAHYRRLSAALDDALGALWFDSGELTDYIRAILPHDPA